MKKLDFLSDLLRRRFAISGMSAEAVNPDSQPTVSRRSTLTPVQRHPESSTRSAREWLKYAAVFLLIFTLGVGNAWGATATLTQAEIQAATAQASYPSNEVSVSSASGTWHGKMIINTSTGFVQIRKNSANNYCGSPTFPGGVTQVVITTCNNTSASRMFYLKANTNTAQPTSGDYGSGSTGSSVNGTATITVTGAPTSFYIYANGAAYISSITVTYTAAATAHTVRFYTASGTYTDLTEASAGAGVTPPTMSTPCDGWAFQGWSKSQSTSSTSTTVLTTETLTDGKYFPDADITLYPVYTKTVSGGTTWTKMATNPVAGDVVILVSEGSTVEGKDKTQTKYITTQTYTEAPAGLLPFTVEAGSPSGWSFKNGSDYLQYNGSNNELNQSTTKNNKSSWTVSVDANGTATITNVASTSRVIQYNSGSPRFACYTSVQQSIQLYKQTAASTTYYYSYPNCTAPTQVATPTFSPDGGTYDDDQTVTISCETANAAIYYTLTTDGSTPTDPTSSSTPYSSTITIDHNNTKIKAIAIKDGMTDSDIASATYTLTCAAPSISPAAESFCTSEEVTITCTTPGVSIYYTTNNTAPTTSSTLYSAPFTITETSTIRAIATKTNYNNSSEATSVTYTGPKTVAEAIAAANGETFYVSGVISYIEEVSTQHGNATYYISADGTRTNELYIYRGKNVGNTDFTSADQIAVGDRVTVYGEKLYYNSTTHELKQNNYICDRTTWTITAVSNNNSYGTVSLTGNTITASPVSGYRVSTSTPYQVTSGTATVTDNGDNTFTVTPSSNCTVQINFEAIPTHTISFDTNGLNSIPSVTVAEGATHTITEAPTGLSGSCEYPDFVGWTTESSTYVHGTSPLYTTSITMSTGDITLHAVYSKTTGGGASTWNQVTDATDVTAGTYVIVASTTSYTGYLPNNGAGDVAPTFTTGVTISDGRITSSVTDAMKWTFSSGSWDDDENYMENITITSVEETPRYLHNISNNNGVRINSESGTWTIGNHESGTSDVLYLWCNGRYCGVYNNADWRSYTTYNATNYEADAGSSKILLFKQTAGGTTTYSLDANCCTPLAAIKEKVTYSNPTSAVVGWHKDANVASYTLRYKTHDAGTWTTAWANKVAGTDSEISLTDRVGSSSGTNDSCYTTITTACGTAYDFRIVANPTSGHCPDSVQIDNQNSGNWEVSYTFTGSNAEKLSGPNAGATVCGNYSATFQALNGKVLPSDIAVSIGGVVQTIVTDYTWSVSNGVGTLSIASAKITGAIAISITSIDPSCSSYSFHDGTHGSNPSDWQINCFTYSGNSDRQWLKNFTARNKPNYYVGYQGYFYNSNLGNSGAKSYENEMQYMQLALDRGHNSNNQLGSNYAGVQGTLLCYDNSSSDNLYVDFLPDGYYFILDAAGTPTALPMTCTNADMTAANILSSNSVWETTVQTVTSVSYKYTVGIKADATIAGKTWQTTRYNTNEDMTSLQKRNSAGGFTGTLAAADVTNGTRGKYRIWADNFSTTSGEKNWYAHFVPYFHVTYNGNGALSGSTAASVDVSCEGDASARTVNAAENGFTGPAHTTFGGWATSASGAKVYDENDPITLTTDVELFAIWEPEANATITLSNYTGSPAPTNLYAGDSWNLPSANTYVCGEKTFVGWSTVPVATTDTKPVSNFYEPGASVTLAATNTFYAVFADGGTNDYELVTSASTALAAGDEIILASSGEAGSAKAMGKKNDNNRSSVDVTISDGGIIENPTLATSTDNTTDIYPFVLETNGDDFAIKDVLHDKYLTANGAGSSGNNFLRTNDGPANATTQKFTITVDAAGAATITGHNDAANARNNMRYNGSNNPPIFSCYSTGQSPIYIYRKPPTTGYSTTCPTCETVTVAYTASPTGGTVGVKKGVTSIAPNGTVNVCGSAVALTVTLTPAEHYTATGLTAVLGSTPLSPTNVGNVYTVTLPADATTSTLTLTPTFTAETPLTITFDVSSVSGVTAGSIGTIYSGDDFDFPNVSGVPVGFCADFLGWVDATNGTTFDGDGTTTTEPAELIEVGDNSGPITTNKTYKAVYGEPETEEVEAYFKVTSTPADWENDHYLIVYEDGNVAFDGSLSTLDAVENTVDVTITSGVIAYSSALAASEFRIAEITDGYSIQSASGYYIGQTSDANGMATNSSDAYANALAISSGDFDATSSSAHLRFNSASNQLRFRYYKSASYAGQNAVQLYKLGTDNVVTYTYTTAPSCGDKYRVTVASVTGGSPSASPKYCADGTTISLVANPANGYSFTSWTITKDGTDPLEDVTSTLLGANSTTASTSFTMPAYDVTVTAAYSITNYNITYNNLNGATNSNPATYNVASADIEFVAPGARAGYIFKGWYDDAVYTNQVTGIPNGSTGAVTVYAKWAVGHTITWDNAIGVNPASTGVEDGQAIGTLPVPTGSCSYDGTTYSNFVGWYTGTISGVGTAASDAGTEVTGATTPGSDVTYHAVYTNMADYSGTNTSNVTLPASPSSPVATAKIKVSSEDDAPEYDGIKIGTSKNKTGSFTFTVPSGTTKITLHGVAWSGKTASVTLATSVGTISPSTEQSLDDNSGASDNSPFTITSNTTLTFNLANVNSEATITVSNSSERVIVWGINASSASGSDVGYITSCCDNLLAAPTMNSPTVRTSTAITLSWNTVPNATGYKVSWNGGDWEDVGTATTYEKTSLEPGNDYSYKVIAKYTSPYCGASAYEGVVSTKPVYSVTYQRGSGTGSCSATGSIPAVAYYEEGATVSLAASNTFSLSGNTFDAWSSEQVALTASSTSFTMPAEDVIITATWMANVDKFYDRMHNLTSGEGSHTDAQGKHYITREGCNYTVPALEDNTEGETACHTSHYVLLGWIAGGHLDSEGKVKSGEESYIFTGGGTKTAGGNTYYAVWAEVTE